MCLEKDSPRHTVFPPPLLHCNCPPQAAEPCSHTVTGGSCWLVSCVDFGNGYHYSHCRLCNLTSAQPSPIPPLLNSSAISPSENLARHSVMVRHHMRSRKGGTRGGCARPQAMPSPEPAAPSPSPKLSYPHSSVLGKYPNTRSGRGGAQFPGGGRNTANFPLPPHPAPHSTQFRFCSNLNRPVITATITIVFTEENELQAASAGSTEAQQEEAHRYRNGRGTGKHLLDEEMDALHGKAMGGGQHAAGGSSRATRPPSGSMTDALAPHAAASSTGGNHPTCGPHRGVSEEEDDWYQYACPVEEIPISNEFK